MKLAILRAIAPGRRFGVAWWLYPDEAHNADCRTSTILMRSSGGELDPDLFDGLRPVVARGDRNVAALQAAGFLADAVSCDAQIPVHGNPAERRAARARWFASVVATLADCDLVFLDHNGLETKPSTRGRRNPGKASVSPKCRRSPKAVAPWSYHHRTRMAGGHLFQLAH